MTEHASRTPFDHDPSLPSTSRPTGKVVHVGQNGEIAIALHQQTQDQTCGQACLAMLGYDADSMTFEEGTVAIVDLYRLHGEEVAVDDEYLFDTPHMMLGMKRETENYHWFLRLNQASVVNPEVGIIEDAKEYIAREINVVDAFVMYMKVPLGPNAGLQEEA